MKRELYSIAKRTLLLIRHGQYSPAFEKKAEQLSTLGKKQAKLIGLRLRDYKISRIISSTMLRAIQTAEIIKANTSFTKKIQTTNLL